MTQCATTTMSLIDLFFGYVEMIIKQCYDMDGVIRLTDMVNEHIKNTTVLYTKHIEDRYFENEHRPKKRSKTDHVEYLTMFLNHKQYRNLNPLTRMWLFAALNIPRAISCLSKSQFKSFVDDLYHQVDKCKITHGDTVGIIAAQSCSERFTQSALNSFHSAGVKKSALVGIRRIEEILDAYKKLNLPVMGPIKTKYNVNKLIEKRLKDYCESSGVIYEPSLSPSDKFSNYLLYFKLKNTSDWEEIKNSKYFNSKKHNDVFLKDDTVYFLLHKNASIELPKLPLENNAKHAPIPHHVFSSYNMEANRHVSGLKHCVEYDEEDNLLFFKSKTSLAPCTKSPFPDQPDTFKSNVDLSELLRICPDVDLSKLISNDIYWIYTTLGITAVEQYLTREINSVLGAEGININIQHINLITANMTHTGDIRANKYAGLKGNDSIIRKATFQQGTETFAKAAADSAVDNISDVSSQILMGKLASVGSALSYVVSDVVEREQQPPPPPQVPPSPEYAPSSPKYSPTVNDNDHSEYVPASPINDLMFEPEIHI